MKPLRHLVISIINEVRGSVRSGALSLFAGLMSANAVAYGYQMFMARVMSPADYGALVTLTSISYVLGVLARTLQAWIIKAVCSRAESDGQIYNVFRAAMTTVIPLGALIWAIHWVASSWLAGFFRLETSVPIIILGIYAFTSFLIPVPRGLLLGLNRLHVAGVIYGVEAVGRLLAGIVLVRLGFGLNGAIFSYAVGDLLALACALVPLWALLQQRQENEAPSELQLGALDGYALVVLITNSLLIFMASIDQIAVRHFFSEHVAGNYAVAFLLGRIIVMSTMAVGWTIFARAASVPAADMRQRRLFYKGLLVTCCIVSSLSLGYLLAPKLSARLMAGAQYETADIYVGMVAIEMSLFALIYIQAYYLIAVKQIQVVWPLVIGFVIDLSVLARYHPSVEQILSNRIMVMSALLIFVSSLSWLTLRSNSIVASASLTATPHRAPDLGT